MQSVIKAYVRDVVLIEFHLKLYKSNEDSCDVTSNLTLDAAIMFS
jgi:hypothetical protein